MWFNFALIVSLLLCNSCLSSVLQESNSDRNGSSRDNLQQPIPNGNSRNQTKFDDLNDDVLYTIFKFLNVRSFVNMFEIKPRFAKLTHQAFRQKYRNYKFEIFSTKYTSDEYSDHFSFKVLQIWNQDLQLKTLEYFWCEINDLHIFDAELPENQSKIIYRFANEYTSESLTRFFWANVHTTGDIDFSMFDVHIPHLEYLEIHGGWWNDTVHRILEGIVLKNTQIQSACVLDFPEDYIRNIDQHLPNVKKLTIRNVSTEKKPIHVKNVKHFAIDTFYPEFIEQLTFSELISMKM